MEPYLLLDGLRVEPTSVEADRWWFWLRLPANEIRLVSGSARPHELLGTADDRRLGVCLRRICWRKGDMVMEVSPDQPGFIDGFHLVEYDGNEGAASSFRWTNGNAGLPPALIPAWDGGVGLELTLSFWEGSMMDPLAPQDAASILEAFESLGENCGLALAQRHYGVDQPLTLFRWAATTDEKLLSGLANRFSGLGEANTIVRPVFQEDHRLDTPYLDFHTFDYRPRDAASLAQMVMLGNGTLRLLRRKLLRDIAEARRIFVFKTESESFGREEAHRLHHALRTIGPASLLCVTPGPEGQVACLADGLYAGCLEPSALQDKDSQLAFQAWLNLCSRTLALNSKVSRTRAFA